MQRRCELTGRSSQMMSPTSCLGTSLPKDLPKKKGRWGWRGITGALHDPLSFLATLHHGHRSYSLHTSALVQMQHFRPPRLACRRAVDEAHR